METITFSDNLNTEESSSINVETTKDNEVGVHFIEEFCKRFPESPECLEYDV